MPDFLRPSSYIIPSTCGLEFAESYLASSSMLPPHVHLQLTRSASGLTTNDCVGFATDLCLRLVPQTC